MVFGEDFEGLEDEEEDFPEETPEDPSKSLYLGNQEEHKALKAELAASIAAGKPKLHLICGGTGCGKSKAIKDGQNNFINANLAIMVTPSDIKSGRIADDVPPELAALLKEMHDEKGIDVKHYVYVDQKRKLLVVVADGETPPADAHAREVLGRIAKLVAEKPDGFNIVWIADAPIPLQKASIFKQTDSAAAQKKAHNLGVQMLEKSHKELVATHTLHYDPQQIKKVLWDRLSDRENGRDFLDELRDGKTHWDTTKEWENAYMAALDNKSGKYDKAFAVLARRAETDKIVAA